MRQRVGTLAIVLSLGAVSAAAQSSGRFHLVRSTSGSHGSVEGQRFIMEDPRTTFRAGEDHQVLVLFEWQGPVGHHRCKGTWKDPSGRVVFSSESQVDARGPRFSVYWGLSLPDVVATGTWVIEASVDGEPAGAHAFQIVAEPGPIEEPTRRALSVAELYERGLADTVGLEVLNDAGVRIRTTSGLFVTPNLVLATFSGINAGRRVRLIAADGRRLETNEIVSWNTREDFAFLRFENAGGHPPMRASDPLQVGDPCYFLEAQAGGGRNIVETAVVGMSPKGDLRLNQVAGEATYGVPVLNEYGEVVAAIEGSGLAGASILDLVGLDVPQAQAISSVGRARPIPPSPDENGVAKTLQDLAEAGQFVEPLHETDHFVQGVLGTGVTKLGAVPIASGQRLHFSRGEKSCVAFVTWTPARKQDSTTEFRLFDVDNRKLGASDQARVKLRPGHSFVQYWTIDIGALVPGIYRVDVVLGADPVWRTFFRVTP